MKTISKTLCATLALSGLLYGAGCSCSFMRKPGPIVGEWTIDYQASSGISAWTARLDISIEPDGKARFDGYSGVAYGKMWLQGNEVMAEFPENKNDSPSFLRISNDAKLYYRTDRDILELTPVFKGDAHIIWVRRA